MIIKGNPNQVVQRRVRKQGRWRVVELFSFDENGLKEFDETKVAPDVMERIKTVFKVVDDATSTKEEKTLKQPENAVEAMSFTELKTYAKSLGINTYGMKKDEIIAAIDGKTATEV